MRELFHSLVVLPPSHVFFWGGVWVRRAPDRRRVLYPKFCVRFPPSRICREGLREFIGLYTPSFAPAFLSLRPGWKGVRSSAGLCAPSFASVLVRLGSDRERVRDLAASGPYLQLCVRRNAARFSLELSQSYSQKVSNGLHQPKFSNCHLAQTFSVFPSPFLFFQKNNSQISAYLQI